MRLVRFRASNVYGYMNFDINFHQDVNFLVGSNGSGKSTVIKLMKSLLTPNINELLITPYESIDLSYYDKGKINTISSSKNLIQIEISHSYVDDVFVFPISNNEDFINNVIDSREKNINQVSLENVQHPVLKKIKSIFSPVFLGIDRKLESFDDDSFRHREIYYRNKFINEKKKMSNGSLSSALLSTEILIQETYRRIRDREEKHSVYLRDNILRSAFKFTSFNAEDLEPKNINWEEKTKILKRKVEIVQAINKIGNISKELLIEIDDFFENLNSLFIDMKKGSAINIGWFLNKAQVERISDLLDTIDEYNKDVALMYQPINHFLSTVNSFFLDSKKKIEINTVGHLLIARPDGVKCDLDILSSGERQLLVIIANVMLNMYADNSGVIVIDEPEISLHLKWQEMFSETILEVSPNTQFIMATHSPDIVGELVDKCISVGV